jgi:hypothetical protein
MTEKRKICGRKTRKFGDKIYHVYHGVATKSEASSLAKRLREEGRLVRVVETKYWYMVFVHQG